MTLTGRTHLPLREWPDEISRQPGAGHPSAAAGGCPGLAMWSPLGPGRDSLAAIFLGRHVAHRLGELPAVAGQVFDGAFPLAVLPAGGWLEHPGPVGPGPLVAGLDVVNPDLHQVGRDALWGGWCSPRTSATIIAPSSPMLICARWLSPIRVRSAKPNAAFSHATACRTSG